jgi:hypothetical protein
MNIMKKNALSTLLTSAPLLPQSTYASLTTGGAEVTMNLPLFASLTGLDDFSLNINTGVDVDGNSTYLGGDVFHLESNGQVTVTVTGDQLSLNASPITTEYVFDVLASNTFSTTVDSAHNADHEITARATLGEVSDQRVITKSCVWAIN